VILEVQKSNVIELTHYADIWIKASVC